MIFAFSDKLLLSLFFLFHSYICITQLIMEKTHNLLVKKPKEALEKIVISERTTSKLSFLMSL